MQCDILRVDMYCDTVAREHCLIQKLTRLDPERFCDLRHHLDSRIARTALDVADVSPVDACMVGEGFLTFPALLAEPCHILAQSFLDVAHPTGQVPDVTHQSTDDE